MFDPYSEAKPKSLTQLKKGDWIDTMNREVPCSSSVIGVANILNKYSLKGKDRWGKRMI